MKKILVMTLLAAALAGASATACTYPGPAATLIPDGASATKQQMLAAQKSVKKYVADIEAYLACLDKKESSLGEAATPEQSEMHTQRYNAAVDAMHAYSDKFNVAVRAYKAANR